MNKENCYDLGIIQAFTDGELASDLQERLIGHIALCDGCATLLAETEDESAFAFSALDEGLNVLVPTERLRTKVFASIKEAKEKAGWWKKITESLGLAEGFSFKSPSLVAFASVVLFVSALAIGVNFYEPMPSVDVVRVNDRTPIKTPVEVGFTVEDDKTDINEETEDESDVEETPTIQQPSSNEIRAINAGVIITADRNNNFKARKATYYSKPVSPKTNEVQTPTALSPSPNLQGEDSYLQTIATLNRTVNINKDLTLRPKERVSFERDLAVVDDAIKKMKKEVRTNPKNQAAREVLRSSYENKIDLLNSVAEKNELMASIQ